MILVIGEALIDLIENRYQSGCFNAVVGGANANVALALARRGTKHQFLGRISNDRFGKIIRERLESNGVHLEHSVAAEELTTLAVVSIDSNGVPSYAFYVNGTADWGWTPAELPTDSDLENMHATAIQFGCLTMAIEPGNKVVENWAKELQNDLTISHDINVRPALGFDRAEERAKFEAELKRQNFAQEQTYKTATAEMKAQFNQQNKEIEMLNRTIETLKHEIVEQRLLTKEIAQAGSKSQITQTIGKN